MTYNIEYVASYQRLINNLCCGVCLRGNSPAERRSSGIVEGGPPLLVYIKRS